MTAARAFLRRAVLLLVLLPAIIITAPSTRAAEPADIDGVLDVVIVEDFDRHTFRHEYFLREDGGRNWFKLRFERMPQGHLRTGQRLRVRGHSRGRDLDVESLDTARTASAPQTPPTAELDAGLNERRAVVLMVNLSNAKASTRYTLAQIASAMWTGTRSVDSLYREASLGQVTFPPDTNGNGTADVYGPISIAASAQTCDFYGWASAAEAAAQSAGIDLSLYQHRVFVLPHYSSLPACGWAGVANIGCGTYCRAWIAEAESPMVYAHELGHNLNMAHAGIDPGNDGTIDNVYGDASDPMGSSRSWRVFNAAHLDQMGWYAGVPGSISTVLSSGSYEIAAIGSDPAIAGSPIMLKIDRPNASDYYYLSYRQPIGYDDAMSSTYTRGVNVHRYQGSGYGYTSFVKSLTDGGTFDDTAGGIRVSQVSHDEGSVVVEVAFGCAVAAPSVTLSPATKIVRPRTAASFAVSVRNGDGGCGTTTFSLSSTGEVVGTMSPTSLKLASGASGTGSLSVGGVAGEGSYAVSVRTADTDGVAPAHSQPGTGSATLIVDGTPPTAPTGLRVSSNRGGKISLRWNAAIDALSGVQSYTVSRDGVSVGSTSATSFSNNGLVSGRTYSYRVTAIDGAGNTSASSTSVAVTAR